ncbi:MAG: SufE family protein [Bacteroidales bacterium]|nr:SufE family protein [Bacteroidales bacterium]
MLEDRKEAVIGEFSLFDEWLDKYEYLIELGKSLPPFPESSRTEENLIKGCQSKVWLDVQNDAGRLSFVADSDALITRGIIALLVRVYSGCTPAEIAEDDFAFLDTLGLKENLSPTRAGGLAAMVATLKRLAREQIQP